MVDPLVEGLSLEPLYTLFRDTSVVKVFHAARQDLEIFFVDAGVFPEPLFDTQVAAMVCGFGEQVGYETLVRKISREGVDKTSRFTDWSRRPLTDAQANTRWRMSPSCAKSMNILAERLRRQGAARGCGRIGHSDQIRHLRRGALKTRGSG